MKVLQINRNPLEAARQIINQNEYEKDYQITRFPDELIQNSAFWTELIKGDKSWIGRVPERMFEDKNFMNSIDKVKFYECIPKKYLTTADYLKYKKSGVKSYKCMREPVETTNGAYKWYRFNNACNSLYLKQEEIEENIDTIVNCIICGYENVKSFCDEVWSQKLADAMWTADVEFWDLLSIPEKYIRTEWKLIIDIFVNKRKPILGEGEKFIYFSNELYKYWGTFSDEAEFIAAFDLEQKIKNSCTRYTEDQEFLSDEKEKKLHENMGLLWDSLKVKNQFIIDNLYSIYGDYFAAVVPNEYFKEEWLKKATEHEITRHKGYLKKLNMTETEVEKLEAKDTVDESEREILEIIMSVRPNFSEKEAAEWMKKELQYNVN